MTMKHEVCVCGHCRCMHMGWYQGCLRDKCVRYTWPGRGADLPDFHKPTQKYKAKVTNIEGKP